MPKGSPPGLQTINLSPIHSGFWIILNFGGCIIHYYSECTSLRNDKKGGLAVGRNILFALIENAYCPVVKL